jgi:hypothetical protein
MVLLIIIPIKWLFVWEYTLFSDKPKFCFGSQSLALPLSVFWLRLRKDAPDDPKPR